MPIPQDYISSVEQSSYTDETVAMNGDEYEYYDEGTTQPYKKQITQSHHHWQTFFFTKFLHFPTIWIRYLMFNLCFDD